MATLLRKLTPAFQEMSRMCPIPLLAQIGVATRAAGPGAIVPCCLEARHTVGVVTSIEAHRRELEQRIETSRM